MSDCGFYFSGESWLVHFPCTSGSHTTHDPWPHLWTSLSPGSKTHHPILTMTSYPFSSLSPWHPPHPVFDSLRPPILDQLLIKAPPLLTSCPTCQGPRSIIQCLLSLYSAPLPIASHFHPAKSKFWTNPIAITTFSTLEPRCSVFLVKIRKAHILLIKLTSPATLFLVSLPLSLCLFSFSIWNSFPTWPQGLASSLFSPHTLSGWSHACSHFTLPLLSWLLTEPHHQRRLCTKFQIQLSPRQL